MEDALSCVAFFETLEVVPAMAPASRGILCCIVSLVSRKCGDENYCSRCNVRHSWHGRRPYEHQRASCFICNTETRSIQWQLLEYHTLTMKYRICRLVLRCEPARAMLFNPSSRLRKKRCFLCCACHLELKAFLSSCSGITCFEIYVLMPCMIHDPRG